MSNFEPTEEQQAIIFPGKFSELFDFMISELRF